MIQHKFFPSFQPDQVLTHEDLNRVITHLEAEILGGRRCLSGQGIRCGLELTYSKKNLLLSPGIALTSAGQMVILQQRAVLTHRVAGDYVDPSGHLPELLGKDPEDTGLWEVVEADEAEDDATALADVDANAMAQRALILYMESVEADLTTCLAGDCDNRGKEQQYNWRAILIKKEHLRQIMADGDSRLAGVSGEDQFRNILQPEYGLQPPVLPRPQVDPEAVHTYQSLARPWADKCTEAFSDLALAAASMWQALWPILPAKFRKEDPLSDLKTDLSRTLAKFVRDDYRRIQIFYDHLDDLARALRELIDAATACTGFCCGSGDFERHVMVGPATPENRCPPTIYRHFWQPSPARCEYGSTTDHLRFLYHRVVTLVRAFTARADKPSAAHVLPEKRSSGLLSDRVLPPYYRHESVREAWDYAASGRCLTASLPAAGASRNGEDPLTLSVEDRDFFRVHGHLGRPQGEVVKELNSLREERNLGFKVVAVPLGKPGQSPTAGSIEALRHLYEISHAELVCALRAKIDFLSGLETEEEKEKEETPGTGGLIGKTPAKTMLGSRYRKVIDYSSYNPFEKRKPSGEETPSPASEETPSSPSETPISTPGTPGFRMRETRSADLAATPTTGRGAEIHPAIETAGIRTFGRVSPAAAGNILELPEMTVVEVGDIAVSFPNRPFLPGKIDPKVGATLALQTLIGKLTALVEVLPEGPQDFPTEQFDELYSGATDAARSLREAVVKLLESDDYTAIGFEQPLIARIDDFLGDCRHTRLTEIVSSWEQEHERLQEAGTFGDFLREHPGVEHRAGVPKGGTLVLVYRPTTRGEELKKIAAEARRVRMVAQPVRKARPAAGSLLMDLTRHAARFDTDAAALRSEVETKLPGIAEQPVIQPGRISELWNPFLESILQQGTEEEVVVADFCLPYLCCSERPTVSYLVVGEMKMSLPKTQFCADETGPYAFSLQPPGGTVEGPGVTRQGDLWTFSPSGADVEPGEATFTYSLGDRQTSLTVELLARPTAAFEFSIDDVSASQAAVSFINRSENATEYRWDFGDDNTSTEPSPTHTYILGADNSFEVTLTAINGPCTAETGQTITIQRVSFDIESESREFCSDDERDYPFVVEPSGGKVTGPGVEPSSDVPSGFVFRPARVDLGEETERSVTPKYTLEGQEYPLQLTVVAPPEPRFTFTVQAPRPTERETRGFQVKFVSTTEGADSLRWDFGDESEEAFAATVTHVYKQSGTYKVTLTAVRGPCQASVAREVKVGGVSDESLQKIVQRQADRALELASSGEFPELVGERANAAETLRKFAGLLREMSEDVNALREMATGDQHLELLVRTVKSLGVIHDNLLRSGDRLSESERMQVVEIYRTFTAAIVALMSLREKDLRPGSELEESLSRLAGQTRNLSRRFEFDSLEDPVPELDNEAIWAANPRLGQIMLRILRDL